MKIRPHTFPRSGSSKINVTPLIDVVMVLIIFYLLVGKLASDRHAPVSLPASAAGQTETSASTLVVSIARGESGESILTVNDIPVALADLATVLKSKAAAAMPGISIRADRRLAFAQVRPVLDACRDAGLTSVRLATRREPRNAGVGQGGEAAGGGGA